MDQDQVGNYEPDDDEPFAPRSRKTRIKDAAEEMSRREVGDLSAVGEYLKRAEGDINWTDLNAAMKNDGWVFISSRPYQNRDGVTLYEAVRYQYGKLKSKKRFIIKRTRDDGRLLLNAGPVRVPYNLPDVIAQTDKPLVLVEGEHGADYLKSQGLRVTCVQGQNWTEDVAEFFTEQDVVVCMDNDPAGRKNTFAALEWLAKVGAKVRVPRLPGLKRRQGLDDWIQEHSVEEFLTLVEGTEPEPSGSSATVIDPTTWEGQPVPERKWIVDPLIPDKNTSLLYGDGGLGKSLLAAQLAVARATRNYFLNIAQTTSGRTLLLSAEDDGEELHRRIERICAHYAVKFCDLSDLRIIDLVGQDAVIGELSRTGRIVATELYEFMIGEIIKFQPGLVIVDALADSFAGDENNRTQARQFVSMLRRVCVLHHTAFLAVAHPSLSGMISGRGTSGSTGWSNSVRSRMYMETYESEGKEPDPNLKILRQPKANYSAGGFEVPLRWENGVYVPVEGRQSIDRVVRDAEHEEVFLTILRRLLLQDRSVSNSPGHTYAPKVFLVEKEATEKLITKAQLQAAMVRLFARNAIVLKPYGRPSKGSRRIEEPPSNDTEM